MLGILGIILPALAPALMDGVRGIFAKFTGGAGGQPQNLQEKIQLMSAENDRLRVLADLDKPADNISKWVADLRAAFRYIAILLIWTVTVCSIFVPNIPEAYVMTLLDLSGACFTFVIGERAYIALRK